MRTRFLAACTFFIAVSSTPAHGILIPEDKKLPPLAMVHHRVTIGIEDQVSVTKVEQSFRNHTDRQLEATYIFPVPKGASVNKFTMFIDGKEVSGEMVEAKKANQIYTDIVRRTLDPGLLEYIGHDLLRMRVFPILPRSDQKVTLTFTAVAPQESGVVEYVYPFKTDGKATATLEEFALRGSIKSQHPVQNVYSPTHAISQTRTNDREVTFSFEKNQATLDKDFQLFYTLSSKEIGLTALTYRPISAEPGHFLLLLSPELEASKARIIPRDVVLVMDTSGSMAGVKMDQAKKALKYCLGQFNARDRFTIIGFSTTVNPYRDKLVEASSEYVQHARKWVDDLRASGGTAIHEALQAALALRSNDDSRTFTIVFFTDGQPTIGVTNPEQILKDTIVKKNTNTRIFTFGVGDDVNAALLDRIAEETRAVSTYVRPAEDIEVKASGLYAKISHPVLSNVRLTSGDGVRFEEVYPPQLPDLFYGSQLVVAGRYTGAGPTAIRLTGQVGSETREFVYELTFPERTEEGRDFVEHLWARRKVGFLLDQIRLNGEKKELVDEVMALSKKYGIATPYTSYLIVPDGVMPVAPMPPGSPRPIPFRPMADWQPRLLQEAGGQTKRLDEVAKQLQRQPGNLQENRNKIEDRRLREEAEGKGGGFASGPGKDSPNAKAADEALRQKTSLEQAQRFAASGQQDKLQAGQLGVDYAVAANNLRQQTRLTPTANRTANGRQVLEVGGVWIDEAFDAAMPMVAVKAQSAAYFRILEKQPKMKDVYRLGNYIVWVTPSKKALVIDQSAGVEDLSDEEIATLFIVKK